MSDRSRDRGQHPFVEEIDHNEIQLIEVISDNQSNKNPIKNLTEVVLDPLPTPLIVLKPALSLLCYVNKD